MTNLISLQKVYSDWKKFSGLKERPAHLQSLLPSLCLKQNSFIDNRKVMLEITRKLSESDLIRFDGRKSCVFYQTGYADSQSSFEDICRFELLLREAGCYGPYWGAAAVDLSSMMKYTPEDCVDIFASYLYDRSDKIYFIFTYDTTVSEDRKEAVFHILSRYFNLEQIDSRKRDEQQLRLFLQEKLEVWGVEYLPSSLNAMLKWLVVHKAGLQEAELLVNRTIYFMKSHGLGSCMSMRVVEHCCEAFTVYSEEAEFTVDISDILSAREEEK